MTKCTYKRTYCKQEIFDYFIENIRYGHELDKQLVDCINFENGKIYSYLPMTVKPKQVLKYLRGGGVANREISINCITSMIFDYLNKKENRICILEDATSRPDDNFSKDLKDVIFSFNDEIYFCLTNRELAEEKIKKAIKEAEQLNYFVAVLVQLKEERKDFCSGNTIHQDDFFRLANNVDKIILSAYDGEGYLIWKKV